MKFFSNKLILLLFLFSQVVLAQFELKDSILLPLGIVSKIQTNNLGDIFLINNDQELIKIDLQKKVYHFQLNQNVTKIDTNLSLRTGLILNQQEILFLDDKLNPIQDKINFNLFQIYPEAISITDGQSLWYYDNLEQRIVQWNYQLGKTLSKSSPINFKKDDYSIMDIHQYKTKLFLKSQHHIYQYDLYGQFEEYFQLKKHSYYWFTDNYIYTIDKSSLIKVNLINQEISSFDNFFYGKDFTMRGDELFVIKNKGLYIYTRIKK